MINELKHLEEFQQILSEYRISNESKQILTETRLALMVSPSSAGRNTIIGKLLQTGDYYFIVSDTTRKPRVNNGVPEKSGVNYWYRSEEEVLADLKSGKFLEAAIIHNQQVSGISIRELKKARDEKKIATTDIEIIGVRNIMEAKPDTTAFFVLPPNFDAWMQRMKGRGDMLQAEKKRRLESAVKEFEAALANDYYKFVLNDSVDHAVEQIQEVMHKKVDLGSQQQCRELTKQLLDQTQIWLKTN